MTYEEINNKIADYIATAEQSAKDQGHTLGPWHYEEGYGDYAALTECLSCRAAVSVAYFKGEVKWGPTNAARVMLCVNPGGQR